MGRAQLVMWELSWSLEDYKPRSEVCVNFTRCI